MKTLVRTRFVLAAIAAIATCVVSSVALVDCDDPDPTFAVVDNAFPLVGGGDAAAQTALGKVWWVVTLFPDPIAAGSSSDANRVIPASDYAYALLAPKWDPSSGTPPPTLIPVRTKDKVSVARGDTVHVVISDDTVIGDCAAGHPLSQDDADFITQRIFPGEFSNVTYDASTCTATPSTRDASAASDASPDAEAPRDAAHAGG